MLPDSQESFELLQQTQMRIEQCFGEMSFDSALEYADRIIEGVRRNHPQDLTLIGHLLESVASRCMSMKMWNEAEARYMRILELDDSDHDGDLTWTIGRTLCDLGMIHTHQGRLQDAERELQRVLTMMNEVEGFSIDEVSRALYRLSILRDRQQRHDDARQLFEDARAILEREHGPEHPAIERLQFARAVALTERGDFDEAEILLWRSLICHLGYDTDAPHNSISRIEHLAETYLAQDRPASAEPLLRLVLALKVDSFGKSAPIILGLLERLEATHRQLGQDSTGSLIHDWAEEIGKQQSMGIRGFPADSAAGSAARHLELELEILVPEVTQAGIDMVAGTLGVEDAAVCYAQTTVGQFYQHLGVHEEALYWLRLGISGLRLSRNGPTRRTVRALGKQTMVLAEMGRHMDVRRSLAEMARLSEQVRSEEGRIYDLHRSICMEVMDLYRKRGMTSEVRVLRKRFLRGWRLDRPSLDGL